MSPTQQMLREHPHPSPVDADRLSRCVDACYECAQSCTACADSCLGEDQVAHLVRCIRLNLDCFDACITTGNQLSRQTEAAWGLLNKQLEACAEACRICAEECERHADHHRHCRTCAEACRRCEEACNQLRQAS